MATSWKKTDNLLFALIFLYFSGVKGFITSPPQNTATKVGSQTHLNCSGNNSVLGWTFGDPGNTITLVTLGSLCNVASNYASSYRGEAQGSNTCNLIILNPSLQESGVYSCQDNDLAPKYAVLTVLSSLGTPTVNNSSKVVEGDQLRVTCTVEYGTSISVPVAPFLSWTISGINITNAETTKTNISVTSSITIVTTRDGIPSYDCTAHFLPPASTSNFASNAPSTVYIGATYPITGVYYAPTTPVLSRRIVNVTEHSAIVCAFSELTCSSSANPSPIYTWTNVTTGNVLANGNVLTLAEDNRTYRCTASNKVNSSHAAYTTGISQPRQCVPATTDNIRIFSDDGYCDNATNVCSCVNGSHVNLICNITNAYPLPSITWVDTLKNVLNNTFINATTSGNYTCQVSNQINILTNTTAAKSTRVTNCCSEWKLIVSVIIPWFGECLIVTIIFIVCYATLATPFRAKMLSRFPWLDYMLPCIKKPGEAQRVAEIAEKTPVQSAEITIASEKSRKKKPRKERKTTVKLDSSTKNPPHNGDLQPPAVLNGRPLPPKPRKLEPIKNTLQTQTTISQSFKTNAPEIEAIGFGKDAALKWKIVFVVLLIIVSVTCGIVFFPILITIAYFSPKIKVGDGEYANSDEVKGKPAYLIPLIILMWIGVVVFMFPLAFVIVYFVHCEQMTFRYVVTP